MYSHTPSPPSARREVKIGRHRASGHQSITRFRKTLSQGNKVEHHRATHNILFSGTHYTERVRKRGKKTSWVNREVRGYLGLEEKM